MLLLLSLQRELQLLERTEHDVGTWDRSRVLAQPVRLALWDTQNLGELRAEVVHGLGIVLSSLVVDAYRAAENAAF